MKMSLNFYFKKKEDKKELVNTKVKTFRDFFEVWSPAVIFRAAQSQGGSDSRSCRSRPLTLIHQGLTGSDVIKLLVLLC